MLASVLSSRALEHMAGFMGTVGRGSCADFAGLQIKCLFHCEAAQKYWPFLLTSTNAEYAKPNRLM